MIFFVFSLSTLILAFLFSRVPIIKNKKAFFCFISALLLILVYSLRSFEFGSEGMQSDVKIYKYTYEELSEAPLFTSFAFNRFKSPLYYFTCSLLGHIGIDFRLFSVIIAVFTMATLSFYVYKHSDNEFLSFFIFLGINCFSFSFYLLRQTTAVAFVLIASHLMFANHRIKAIILGIIASLFHLSAIVFIPFLIIKKIKFNSVTGFFIGVAFLATIVLRNQIARLIIILFDDSYEGFYETSFFLGGLFLILFVFLLAFIAFNYKELVHNKNEYINSLFFGMLISCFIQIFSSYSYTFTRLNYFYIQSIAIIAVPQLISKKNFKKSIFDKNTSLLFKKVICFAAFFAIAALYYRSIIDESLDTYLFFWQ